MDILALLQPLENSLSTTTLWQMSRVIIATLAMTGRVTMLGLARWAGEGGSHLPSWRTAFTRLYQIALGHGSGLIHWLGVWSNRPYMIPACDFSFMIGPREFERLLLPDIARQAAAVGRAVFHLDGLGAARHIDALLDVPDIQAIQFTPGSGSPSALAWVDMFRKIQRRGRSVLAICPPEEAIALRDALLPEGLAILLDSLPSPADLDTLFEQFAR